MRRRVRVVALCAVLSLVPTATACTSDSKSPTGSTASPASGASSSSNFVATRWWSNSAAKRESTIDAKDPESAARKLQPSRADYCGMLKQTVAAGKSILPGVTAQDPALLTSTKALMAELQAAAPASVSRPWRVLGSAVVAIVASGGDTTKVKGINGAAVQQAAAAVSADAKRNCGVDLSSATG
jgi:hypothetical protein